MQLGRLIAIDDGAVLTKPFRAAAAADVVTMCHRFQMIEPHTGPDAT